MNKIRVGIIEDEEPAVWLLQELISKLRPKWYIEALPGSVKESVRWLRNNEHPDLLFMDIRLSDGTSFDLLSQVKPDSMIIFTTAYDEYAIKAFDFNSIDYILKPVNGQRLAEAIARYESQNQNTFRPQDYIETLLDALQNCEKRYRTRFLIAKPHQYCTLQVDDIAYFYSKNRITPAVTFAGDKYVIDLPLNRLEEQLNPDRFFRANRQVLLCINTIVKIEPYFNGRLVVSVNPPYKEAITVSEIRIPAFKMWLNY